MIDGRGMEDTGGESQHERAETNATVPTHLGGVRVRAAIGHREEAGAVMAETEVLV